MSRARVWTFITYPESLPENYEEVIQERLTIPFVMSPIHDKDKKKDGDGFKKAHYHNMVMFTNVKSYKQVTELVACLGASHADQVHSTQAMIRYFIHADQADKAQYSKDDIRCFNGADVETLFEKNDKEIYANLNDMLQVIDDNQIIEYSDFVFYVRQNMYSEWFPLVVGQYSFFIRNYITSLRFKNARIEGG